MTFNCNFCAKPCSLKCICGVFYCSDRCQKYDWKYHKKSCPSVSIRVIDEEKGRGLVANRSLHPGQIVLEDYPVILIGSNIKQDHQKDVINQYNSLTEQQINNYNSLSYNTLLKGSGSHLKILNIWYANNVSTQTSMLDKDDVKGIYFQFSMTNHSCAPNCVINFDENRNLKLVAFERIFKGEEIVVNYLDPNRGDQDLLRCERQKKLITIWNFICKCSVCSLTVQDLSRNEEMKKDLAALVEKQDQLVFRVSMTEGYNRKLKLEIKIARILLKLGAETIRELPFCFHRCYFYSIILHIQKVPLRGNPESFRNAAFESSQLLGETYLQMIVNVDKEVDDIIRSFLVVSRKRFYCDFHVHMTEQTKQDLLLKHSQMIATQPNSKNDSNEVSNHSDDQDDDLDHVEGDDNTQAAVKAKQHDSGAADLEKVTDYAEDKEIVSTDNGFEEAIVAIRKKQEQMKADKLARERELAKVPIKKEDVELIMTEMEIPEDRAVRTLREHGGNVVLALTALVNAPF